MIIDLISTRSSGCNSLFYINNFIRYHFDKKLWKHISVPHPNGCGGKYNNFKMIKHVEFITETTFTLNCIFLVKIKEEEDEEEEQENSNTSNKDDFRDSMEQEKSPFKIVQNDHQGKKSKEVILLI